MIKEINETTASVVLEYQLTSQNDEEETELYDVKEFYRMKYQDTRIYLLDFQRSANQSLMVHCLFMRMMGLSLECAIRM